MARKEKNVVDDGKFDPAVVIGLKSDDRILCFGNPAFMPWLSTKNKNAIVEARRTSDVDRLVKSGERFDKVVIGRERQFSDDYIVNASLLLKPGGMIVYLPKDPGESWRFNMSFNFHYPNYAPENVDDSAEFVASSDSVWECDSQFGFIVMAVPPGKSWRLYNK